MACLGLTHEPISQSSKNQLPSKSTIFKNPGEETGVSLGFVTIRISHFQMVALPSGLGVSGYIPSGCSIFESRISVLKLPIDNL